MMSRSICVTLALLLLAGCAVTQPTFEAGTACTAETFSVADDFAGARRGSCEVLARNHVRVSIVAEDKGKINPSPWFAFKLLPQAPGTAIISLGYVGDKHRYVPKISHDGRNWSAVDSDRVRNFHDGRLIRIELPLNDKPVWIAAQELVTPDIYDAWNREMASHSGAKLKLLGQSLEQRPIHYLVSNSALRDVLFLVGRQHPPEVSGAVAFFAFAETVLSDTELARNFRERFQIIAIPMLNPDGVVAGHWRHNKGGTDLNRDWGIFSQPETRAVGQLLDELDETGRRIRVYLDFHSTRKNVLYIPEEGVATKPPGFFRQWLKRVAPRLRNYPVTGEPSSNKGPGIGKNYIFHRYGIPAATYEVGDETGRQAVRLAAVVFAEELMKLMLETVAPTG